MTAETNALNRLDYRDYFAGARQFLSYHIIIVPWLQIDLEDVELLPSGETSSENIVELGFKDLFRLGRDSVCVCEIEIVCERER